MEAPIIDWSAATLAFAGETVSGDAYLVQPFRNGVLIAAIDGLGHGPGASASAQMAVSVLEANPDQPIVTLVRLCHDALKGMRGVVMSLASFDKTKNTMTWLGIGNVEGILLRAAEGRAGERNHLLLRGGIVGSNLPTLIAVTIPLDSGDTLIFASDGIRSDFAFNLKVNTSPQSLVNEIISGSGKNTDDSLVVVARYL